MCNACGFLCCGSDQLHQCGCDHCDCPECWDPEQDDFDAYDDSIEDEEE